jgi:hypothetical protein
VPIPPAFIPYLVAHTQQNERREAAGELWEEQHAFFTRPDGRPVGPETRSSWPRRASETGASTPGAATMSHRRALLWDLSGTPALSEGRSRDFLVAKG